MEDKILNLFIKHLSEYNKIGNLYYEKGYSRSYTEDDIIKHFKNKLNDRR